MPFKYHGWYNTVDVGVSCIYESLFVCAITCLSVFVYCLV